MALFNFLKRTKRLSDLSSPYADTDIHAHLLPGVDDGAPDRDAALQILRYMESMGTKRMFCTPHVMASLKQNRRMFLETEFNRFVDQLDHPMQLKLAAEYMLDEMFESHLEDGLLSFNGREVLVETSYLAPPPNRQELIYAMQLKGYEPIVAHPERYVYASKQFYIQDKNNSCRYQLNLLSLSGYYGRGAKEMSEMLLDNKMYDYVGSDIHHLRIAEFFKKLKLSTKRIDLLQELFDNNRTLWI